MPTDVCIEPAFVSDAFGDAQLEGAFGRRGGVRAPGACD